MSGDLSHLFAFYTELLDVKQTSRVPDEGPAFYIPCNAVSPKLALLRTASIRWTPAGVSC